MHENLPVLLARVEIDDELKKELAHLPVGAKVDAMVRCGYRSIGYVWFHELWEFFYERDLVLVSSQSSVVRGPWQLLTKDH